MAGAKLGDKVKFLFVIKDESGEVVDEVKEKEPEEIVLGAGDTIPGIEVSLVGMASGDSKTVTLKPDMHFGPRYEDLTLEIEKEQFSDADELEVGGALEYGFDDGSSEFFTITSIGDEMVSLDGNHPFAGKDLTVELKILDIET